MYDTSNGAFTDRNKDLYFIVKFKKRLILIGWPFFGCIPQKNSLNADKVIKPLTSYLVNVKRVTQFNLNLSLLS